MLVPGPKRSAARRESLGHWINGSMRDVISHRRATCAVLAHSHSAAQGGMSAGCTVQQKVEGVWYLHRTLMRAAYSVPRLGTLHCPHPIAHRWPPLSTHLSSWVLWLKVIHSSSPPTLNKMPNTTEFSRSSSTVPRHTCTRTGARTRYLLLARCTRVYLYD